MKLNKIKDFINLYSEPFTTGPGFAFTLRKTLAMLGSILKQYLSNFCGEGSVCIYFPVCGRLIPLQKTLYNRSTAHMPK